VNDPTTGAGSWVQYGVSQNSIVPASSGGYTVPTNSFNEYGPATTAAGVPINEQAGYGLGTDLSSFQGAYTGSTEGGTIGPVTSNALGVSVPLSAIVADSQEEENQPAQTGPAGGATDSGMVLNVNGVASPYLTELAQLAAASTNVSPSDDANYSSDILGIGTNTPNAYADVAPTTQITIAPVFNFGTVVGSNAAQQLVNMVMPQMVAQLRQAGVKI
jgi:hypothetical protein